jgi:hypothetical protein
MRRLPLLLALLLLARAPVAAQEARALSVSYHDSRLSVMAQSVPLREILRELGRATGMQVKLEAGMDQALLGAATTVTIAPAPVDEALRRLLRNVNFIVVSPASGPDELRIYRDGKGPYTRLSSRPPTIVPPAAPPLARARATPLSAAEMAQLRNSALWNTDPGERSRALSRLSAFTDSSFARETALTALERERDSMVIDTAMALLRLQESVPIAPILRFASAGDRPGELRAQALELANEHGREDPTLRRVLRILANDRDEDVRDTAQRILQDIESD